MRREWHVVCKIKGERRIVFSSKFCVEAFNWFHAHCGVDYPRGEGVISDEKASRRNLPKAAEWIDGDASERANLI